MFVDEAIIEVKGGDGGNGIVAFRREKYMPLGGPSGGDGGKGGSVTIVADHHKRTLIELSHVRHHRGTRGRHGEGSRRKGSEGKGATVTVPVGTEIFDAETGELLADLVVAGQKFVAAHGGAGGRGNVHFSTSSRQAPGFSELGGKGEERTLRVSMKLLADVALIGLPNAGKSTLVSAISAAKPKIAAYPFTTLVPNLGVVQLDPSHIFVAADIPGLIAGAHTGAGLGHQFLKHIERAPVFIHLVDPFLPDAFANFEAINEELRLWNEDLAARPQLVALTKMDIVDDENRELLAEVEAQFAAKNIEVFPISAATQSGLQPLLWRAMELVEAQRELVANEPQPEPLIVVKSAVDKPLKIRDSARFADGQSEWEVTGGPLERLSGRFDLTNTEAVFYLHRILERAGVLKEMHNAGVKYGDVVHVGDLSFEWKE